VDTAFLKYLAGELGTSPSDALEALQRPVPAAYVQQQKEFLTKLYAEFLLKKGVVNAFDKGSLQQNSGFETSTSTLASSTPGQVCSLSTLKSWL
jgi:hypothetical protein